MDLNPAQYDAVQTLSGPLLVLAGAGTGKTRVVTYRIAELIRNRIAPERILAVTFTNKAADEMQDRTARLLGKRPKQRPEMSTFHSLCVRILRRHVRQLGYPANFAIYDRGDQEGVARSVLREIKVADGLLRPGDLLYFIGRWKTASVRPEEAAALAQTDKEHLAAAAYRRYQNAIKAAGAMDFDDLLLCAEELLEQVPQGTAGRGRPLRSLVGRRVSGHQRQPVSDRQSVWRPGIATCAWWATTTSRSTAGGAPRWPTSSASRTTGPRPRSCAWRSTTAPPAKSSIGPTG